MKLIAIDLDGTLLNTDLSISKRNAEAILQAQKAGHIVTICTGRSMHDTQKFLTNAGLDIPFIAGNGAVVFYEKVLHNEVIPENVLIEVIDLFRRKETYYEIFTEDGILFDEIGMAYFEQENKELHKQDHREQELMQHEIEKMKKENYFLVVPDCKKIDLTSFKPYKIYSLTFSDKKMKKMKEILKLKNDLSFTSGSSLTLEVGNKNVSKGNALKILADHLQIAPENLVAIGDNLNDLSMFRIAGTSIAMGNALEEVKACADHVTKNFDEDGVAYALEKFIL